MEQTIAPITEEEFVNFAAIEIFTAMVVAYRNPESFRDVDARAAWKLAKILHDAKPVQDGSISREMTIIRLRVQTDSDLAWTWHCNIACAFLDEGGSHKQANEAAARFMLSAFGVDVRLSDQWKSMVAMINTDPV
ncbi:hypothetical protein SH449x_004091 [Pirellulaceae bacterium SH449]